MLALSGGGLRATLFHLGVFVYLAQTTRLQNVRGIVSVSGENILAAHSQRNGKQRRGIRKIIAVTAALVRLTRSDLRH